MIELRKEDMFNINGGANAILITTIIGTFSQKEVALDKFLITFGNNFLEVPSMQNQIRLTLESSCPSLALFLDHFLTALTAFISLMRFGSNPIVSMILNGILSLS